MYRRAIVSAVLAALAMPGLGIASPAPITYPGNVSALALPILAPAADVSVSTADAVADATPVLAYRGDGTMVRGGGTTFEYVSYRPHHHHSSDRDEDRSEPSRSSGYAQIHGGFFDPEGDHANASVFGFRAGGGIDQHFALGLGLDWQRRAEERSEVVREVPVPGGTAEQKIQLGHQSSDLFPTMAFLQVSPGGSGFTPYFGIGGGYEVLLLSAEDFTTGSKFDATYGGWGWQAWAGLAIPIANRTKLAAEVYTNSADVSRDVNDPINGQAEKETISLNGAGARFGLSWGF